MDENPNKSLDLLGIKPFGDAVDTAVTSSFDGAAEFLRRICPPAAEEFGDLLRDRVRMWRAINGAKIVQKTEAKLNSQLESDRKRAHPRIVAQIVEQGAWIEADDVQELWAGLLASSCTLDGKDDSNLIFVDLLSRLAVSQARILDYICENAEKTLAPAGWLVPAAPLELSVEELQRITKLSDVHRMDLELDHLGSLGLLGMGSGFGLHSRLASLQPSSLALQMYARCHGYSGNPISFYVYRAG
jgi:hypothetical protein